MMLFSVVFIIPMLIALGFKFIGKQICWKEFACIGGAAFVVAFASSLICYYASTSDTEILNGVVTGKERNVVSCTHSYTCNCRTTTSGSGKNATTTTTCDTCYEHLNDYDWDVHTSVGSVTIDRVDRQGTYQPQRWTSAIIGEPASIEHTYTNYIKASPDSLFRHQGLKEKYAGFIPVYPQVFDYYRANRFISVNGAPVQAGWNEALSKLNSMVGPRDQANVSIVLAKGLPIDYYSALEEAWIGGKKNDIIVVIGTNDGLTPAWVQVMAWTTKEIFKVKVRDHIMALDNLKQENIIPILNKDILLSYERKPMKDFEYLQASITPSGLQYAITLIIGILITVGLSIYFHVNDVFYSYKNSYGYNPRRYRRW